MLLVVRGIQTDSGYVDKDNLPLWVSLGNGTDQGGCSVDPRVPDVLFEAVMVRTGQS